MADRTCIITGNTQPAHRLIRFVVSPAGYVVADLAGRLPGRGAWIVASEDLISTAVSRGHFKRALGASFPNDCNAIATIAKQLRSRALSVACMARRAGVLLGGSGKLLAEGHCVGLIAADDSSLREMEKLRSKLRVNWVSRSFSAPELGQICGRDSLAFVGVLKSKAPGAAKLSDILHKEILRLDGFYSPLGCNDLQDGCIT